MICYAANGGAPWVYFKFSLLYQFAVTFYGCFFHFCLDTKVEQKIKAA